MQDLLIGLILIIIAIGVIFIAVVVGISLLVGAALLWRIMIPLFCAWLGGWIGFFFGVGLVVLISGILATVKLVHKEGWRSFFELLDDAAESSVFFGKKMARSRAERLKKRRSEDNSEKEESE